MRKGVVQAFDSVFGGCMMAIAVFGFNIEYVVVLGDGQFTYRPVHPFFFLLRQTRHCQFRLGARDIDAFAVTGNELQCEPAEYIIGD